MEDAALTNQVAFNNNKRSLFTNQNNNNNIDDSTDSNNNTTQKRVVSRASKPIVSNQSIELRESIKIENNNYINSDNINEMSAKTQSNQNSQNNNKMSNSIITVSEIQSKVGSNKIVEKGVEADITSSLSTSLQNKESVKKSPIRVTSRIVFLKVGQIDTRNERYDAEAYIEASWEDDKIYKILADPNMTKMLNTPNGLETMIKQAPNVSLNPNPIVNLKNVINNVNALEFDTNLFWSPQLYIENAIGDLKEEIRHKLEIVEREGSDILNDPNFNSKDDQYKNVINNLTVRVFEMRKVRGVFYERLELYDFPMDMQELSITLTSKRSTDEIDLVENKKEPCSINTADFLDQQEWDLFEHVKTSTKIIHDPWRKYDRSGFSVTCFIVRKPGYYLYNAYMLIFLITVLGFVPFAFDTNAPQFRCQVTGLLLLTSVNFRWIVTQRLPSVAYLTSLDKYAIGSLLSLVLFCCWHSIIGSSVITSDNTLKKSIDSYVLYGAAGFYVLYNLFYLIWFLKMSKTNKNIENQFKKEDELTKTPNEILRKLQIEDNANYSAPNYNQVETNNDQANQESNNLSNSSRAPLERQKTNNINNNKERRMPQRMHQQNKKTDTTGNEMAPTFLMNNTLN